MNSAKLNMNHAARVLFLERDLKDKIANNDRCIERIEKTMETTKLVDNVTNSLITSPKVRPDYIFNFGELGKECTGPSDKFDKTDLSKKMRLLWGKQGLYSMTVYDDMSKVIYLGDN